MHEGTCAFTQQGCKYKHEMPLDKATQLSLGLFHGLPSWWKKHQANLSRQREPDAQFDEAQLVTLESVQDPHEPGSPARRQESWRPRGQVALETRSVGSPIQAEFRRQRGLSLTDSLMHKSEPRQLTNTTGSSSFGSNTTTTTCLWGPIGGPIGPASRTPEAMLASAYRSGLGGIGTSNNLALLSKRGENVNEGEYGARFQ